MVGAWPFSDVEAGGGDFDGFRGRRDVVLRFVGIARRRSRRSNRGELLRNEALLVVVGNL